MDSFTFKEILKHPYVIVFDNASGNTLHKVSCFLVTEEDFNHKMKQNHEGSGYYRPLNYYEDIRDASVVPCHQCQPTRKRINGLIQWFFNLCGIGDK